jgi:hypothetical protein
MLGLRWRQKWLVFSSLSIFFGVGFEVSLTEGGVGKRGTTEPVGADLEAWINEIPSK